MHTTLQVRPHVRAAKQRLAEARASLYLQHEEGSPGIQVCAHLADMLDSIVRDVYEAAIRDLQEKDGGRVAAGPRWWSTVDMAVGKSLLIRMWT